MYVDYNTATVSSIANSYVVVDIPVARDSGFFACSCTFEHGRKVLCAECRARAAESNRRYWRRVDKISYDAQRPETRDRTQDREILKMP
jgi:hypothetical protein